MATNSSASRNDNLRDDIDTLREDVGKLAATLKGLAKDQKDTAYASVRTGADAAKKKVQETSDAAAHQIEQRPLFSVLIAFSVGTLLGALLGRRS